MRLTEKSPTLDEPYNPETGYPFHDPEVIKASDVIGARGNAIASDSPSAPNVLNL